MIEIVDPGLRALVEDLGRVGYAASGLGRSGAADRRSLRLGNRLLGNPERVAGIEFTVSPAAVRFDEPTWFALTGAFGTAELAGRPTEPNVAVRADAGELLRLGPAVHGVRRYLTVRGGVDALRMLGSRSVDTLAGLGRPLAVGDRLPVGPDPVLPVPPVDALTVVPPEHDVVVRAHPGPRADWFTRRSRDLLYSVQWRVGSRVDRVGMGLEADAALERATAGELASEAMVAGAVQVAHDGAPTVLLADHPVTGGYPVIAVVDDGDLDVLGQLGSGATVRFRHPLR